MFAILSTATITATADGITSVTHSPHSPHAGETVTFNAIIDGDDITDVTLWIEECSGSICHIPQEIDMTEIQNGEYTVEYTLRDNTTSVHYKIIAEIDGNVIESQEYTIDVKSATSDTEKTTPGFEMILVILSITAILALRRVSR